MQVLIRASRPQPAIFPQPVPISLWVRFRVNPEEWRGEGTRLSPPSSSLHSSPCPFTESPTPCLGSLGMGGGQGSRRQPLDSPLRERSLGLLTQWHYLSSSLGYCSGEHFLSLCKHFLSLA
ncbi:4-hydroxy-tetrahydrodipicolinate synthase 1 [Dissostichus eleginoides]|uniref:4-hydroxy-tetrahydrodipicolinate synthase 1 n=1 Tax=Dissostichus eleginoides TaxID=100907 RepID=A0AAD9BIM0_DISEL|nr:4-hydroxy-tetrahydrodipicolinate synthase 1 [Dissostichus eleginoides]